MTINQTLDITLASAAEQLIMWQSAPAVWPWLTDQYGQYLTRTVEARDQLDPIVKLQTLEDLELFLRFIAKRLSDNQLPHRETARGLASDIARVLTEAYTADDRYIAHTYHAIYDV